MAKESQLQLVERTSLDARSEWRKLSSPTMAGTSLLALLDDISSVLDDVATLTKVATKKTAGVLGDDLALNAQQAAGVQADRELPVVWAVAKGSLVNKAILVPAALAISAVAPWGVTPLLMVGGAYLCFEGFEKIVHTRVHRRADEGGQVAPPVVPKAVSPADIVALEREKVRGAIRTDFVLSAEIVTITLGSVAASPFLTRLLVLSAIGIVMTVGVYGLVAVIVKLDDLGLYLSARGLAGGPSVGARLQRMAGSGLVRVVPWFMKGLSVAGTLAMFLVGGGIVMHGLPWLHLPTESLGALLANAATSVASCLFGVAVGAVVWVGSILVKRALGKSA